MPILSSIKYGYLMKYEAINNELYISNRERFRAKLKTGGLAVFNSNDIVTTSADSTMPFVQHRDILHLSGIDQEESILVIFPNAAKKEHQEILFLKETNDLIKIWEGEKYTKEAAFEASGIKTIYWLDQFETIFKSLVAEAEYIYLNSNEHLRANTEVQSREDRFVLWCKERYPLHKFERSAPIMHQIRSVKHDLELETLQKACDITEKAFRRVLGFVEPGVWEYEIEAEVAHEFLRRRATRFGYTPIIASGANSCVLHYIDNNKQCRDGDILLFDWGAEYANYTADMSRSIPVSGRFSDRQKAVYNAVKRVKEGATKLLIPGVMLDDYHKQVGLLMEKELVDLGLITTEDIRNQDDATPAYKRYFMHGTSHFLGLDTHDVGLWNRPVEKNMVFTVEPGIYIPDEGIGIRLEDDVVVQGAGEPFNLMKNIPLEAEEIEDIMNVEVTSEA